MVGILKANLRLFVLIGLAGVALASSPRSGGPEITCESGIGKLVWENKTRKIKVALNEFHTHFGFRPLRLKYLVKKNMPPHIANSVLECLPPYLYYQRLIEIKCGDSPDRITLHKCAYAAAENLDFQNWFFKFWDNPTSFSKWKLPAKIMPQCEKANGNKKIRENYTGDLEPRDILDPWGRPILLEGGTLITLGGDGKPEGRGPAADCAVD